MINPFSNFIDMVTVVGSSCLTETHLSHSSKIASGSGEENCIFPSVGLSSIFIKFVLTTILLTLSILNLSMFTFHQPFHFGFRFIAYDQPQVALDPIMVYGPSLVCYLGKLWLVCDHDNLKA